MAVGSAVIPTLALAAPSPSSGAHGVASANFTVTATHLGGPLTVTPAAPGATVSPSSVILSPAELVGSFTITPVAPGAISVGISNAANIQNPAAVNYTAV